MPPRRPTSKRSLVRTDDQTKADNTLVALRTEMVYRMILDGYPNTVIVTNLSKAWSVTERSVYDYLKRARQRLEAESSEYRKQALAEHVAVRRRLRREALDSNDRRLALEIVRDEAKLLGLYAPEKTALTTPDGKDALPMAPAVAVYLPKEDPSPIEAATIPQLPYRADLEDDADDISANPTGSSPA